MTSSTKSIAFTLGFVLSAALWTALLLLLSAGQGFGWFITVGQAIALSGLAAIGGGCLFVAASASRKRDTT